MRMHNGKWSSNILVGALTVFCLLLLYNYWTVSSLNHDLIQKIHSLEERMIQMSSANDALQVSLDKVQDIKDKVEGNLRKEQLVEVKAKEDIAQKSNKIKSLLNDVENSKQATQNCREELTLSESKVAEREKEVAEFKGKVVSLEARLVEKNNKVSRMEKELAEVKQRLGGLGSSSSSTTKKSAGGDNQAPPVAPAPAIEVAHQDEPDQPVLISDPAVPFPNGWMEHGSVSGALKTIKIREKGDSGVRRTHSMGPVIIFDPPSQKRLKARFSVLDPPPRKNEMKPESVGASPLKHPESLGLVKPLSQTQDEANNNIGNGGGEDFGGGGGGGGVLPAPGHRGDQPLHAEQNLDAAEDDGDRPFKDDFGQGDDQSPDGALSQKEVINAAIQAPDIKHDNDHHN